MSATMALTMSCGTALPALQRAQQQIEELQTQVRLLNEKAAAAVDRWADYEDELSRLRAASVNSSTSTSNSYLSNGTANTAATTAAASASSPSPRSSFLPSAARLSQLLSPRRSLANLYGSSSNNGNNRNSSGSAGGNGSNHHPPPPPPPLLLPSQLKPQPQQSSSLSSSSSQPQRPSTAHPTTNNNNNNSKDEPPVFASQQQQQQQLLLLTTTTTALARERELRRAAEGKLSDTSREVEELSAALFEQANNMVAAERRARAQLEDRVGVLERRDVEKATRLDRLEGAMGRIERVRALLG